jgi:hypothetical protein
MSGGLPLGVIKNDARDILTKLLLNNIEWRKISPKTAHMSRKVGEGTGAGLKGKTQDMISLLTEKSKREVGIVLFIRSKRWQRERQSKVEVKTRKRQELDPRAKSGTGSEGKDRKQNQGQIMLEKQHGFFSLHAIPIFIHYFYLFCLRHFYIFSCLIIFCLRHNYFYLSFLYIFLNTSST